jgi:hypothetical protein
MMKKKSLLIALPMMVALALTGCSHTDTPTKEAQSTPSSSQSSSPPSVTTPAAPAPSKSVEAATHTPQSPAAGNAMDALNKLVVANEADADAYERDYFNHWVSKNKTGCDTRFAVLVSESLVKTKISGCTVISGEWKSVYDGQTVTDPKKLDIDHMVPLKEAWRSGASKWSADQREAYANDLDFPDALVAVTAASNRSKSDDDPTNYLPTDTSNLCSYVSKWVAVKTRWNLTVDATEKDSIKTVLDKCGTTDISTVEKASAPAPATGGTTAVEAPKTETPAPVTPVPAPVAGSGGNDPKFASCSAAIAGGYGPYMKGEPEYEWYRDGDGDGKVCEK